MITTAQTVTIDDEHRNLIRRQIGFMRLLGISGGRVRRLPDGIELPVSNGYVVRVRVSVMDTYLVERVFVRAGQEFMHGVREGTYWEDVGEAAYRAGMFNSYDDEDWQIL